MAEPSGGYLTRRAGVTEKMVGSDVALYVAEDRSIHVLNETARFVWESLQTPMTFDELLFVMGEAFAVDGGQLRRDLRETVDVFTSRRLIETRPETNGPAAP